MQAQVRLARRGRRTHLMMQSTAHGLASIGQICLLNSNHRTITRTVLSALSASGLHLCRCTYNDDGLKDPLPSHFWHIKPVVIVRADSEFIRRYRSFSGAFPGALTLGYRSEACLCLFTKVALHRDHVGSLHIMTPRPI